MSSNSQRLQLLFRPMRERDLQESVRQICRALGRPYYHTHDSRRSPEGFPDVVSVVDGHLLFRELKSASGRCTPAQLRWLAALSQIDRVSATVWTPEDWLTGRIEAEIRGRV